MSQQRRQLIVLAGLAVVMASVYARAFRRPAVATPPTPSQESPQPATLQLAVHSMVSPALAERRAVQRQHAALLTWERDPFLRARGEGSSGLALSGILWDPSTPMAIINGTTLTVGSQVDGWQITEIGQDHVTVNDGTKTYQLRIEQ